MDNISLDFYKILFQDLDPENFKERFLKLLLNIQGVDRGSIWVKKDNTYLCIEAVGSDSDEGSICGTSISVDQPSIVGWVIENAEMTIAEAGKDPRHFKAFEEGMEVKSTCILCFPLILGNGEVYGAVQIIETESGGSRLNLDEGFLKLLKSIVDAGSTALSNALEYAQQVERTQDLEQTLDEIRGAVQIIGQSRPFLNVMKKVRDYAKTDFPVLITGESGTGKDLIAMALHNLSSRRDMPFLVQNCSAIPETLLESELFGYKKGAFTGATEDKTGLLEAAQGGTVFLDEIGDMSLGLQARILRTIQNSEIRPLGETETKKIDVRIISATNRDLGKAIEKKEFREDLFYRINVLPLHLPTLRERKKDIPLLLNYFFRKESLKQGIPKKVISRDVMQQLEDYPWEGNIRELENFVKYIISTIDSTHVDLDMIPHHFRRENLRKRGEGNGRSPHFEERLSGKGSPFETDESPFAGYSWRELEKAYVIYLLEKNRWNVTRAAKDAGINRSTFDSRIKKLDINRK